MTGHFENTKHVLQMATFFFEETTSDFFFFFFFVISFPMMPNGYLPSIIHRVSGE
jgi:hypothetical protein